MRRNVRAHAQMRRRTRHFDLQSGLMFLLKGQNNLILWCVLAIRGEAREMTLTVKMATKKGQKHGFPL